MDITLGQAGTVTKGWRARVDLSSLVPSLGHDDMSMKVARGGLYELDCCDCNRANTLKNTRKSGIRAQRDSTVQLA